MQAYATYTYNLHGVYKFIAQLMIAAHIVASFFEAPVFLRVCDWTRWVRLGTPSHEHGPLVEFYGYNHGDNLQKLGYSTQARPNRAMVIHLKNWNCTTDMCGKSN